jgi:hypothetical protein
MILGEGLNYSYTSKTIGKEETENFVFFSGNIPEYSGILSEIPEFFFSEFFRKIPNFFFRNFIEIPEFFFSEIFRNFPKFFFPELKIPEFFRNSGISGKFYQPY